MMSLFSPHFYSCHAVLFNKTQQDTLSFQGLLPKQSHPRKGEEKRLALCLSIGPRENCDLRMAPNYFAIPSVITDSGKDHQWVLKPLSEEKAFGK